MFPVIHYIHIQSNKLLENMHFQVFIILVSLIMFPCHNYNYPFPSRKTTLFTTTFLPSLMINWLVNSSMQVHFGVSPHGTFLEITISSSRESLCQWEK